MNWLELSVEVDPEAVEPVSELFARLGYNGGVVVEQALVGPQAEQDSWDELQHPEIDPTRPISVRTYLPDDNGRKRSASRSKRRCGTWADADRWRVARARVQGGGLGQRLESILRHPAHGQAYCHQAVVARI